MEVPLFQETSNFFRGNNQLNLEDAWKGWGNGEIERVMLKGPFVDEHGMYMNFIEFRYIHIYT